MLQVAGRTLMEDAATRDGSFSTAYDTIGTPVRQRKGNGVQRSALRSTAALWANAFEYGESLALRSWLESAAP